jgi:uncharacterized secreted repeat protein (TIGR03808 family)
MTISRRHLLTGSAAAAAVFATPLSATLAQGVNAGQFGLRPNAPEDQSPALQRAIDEAARAHRPLWLKPGSYRAGNLQLRAGSRLTGVRGDTRLVLTQGPALLTAQGVDAVSLSNLTLDGGNRPLDANGGVINFMAAKNLSITDCAISAANGNGIALYRCSGAVSGNRITGSSDNAIFSNDSKLTISANTIAKSGNGGIRVWRSVKQSDGSVVEGNMIEDTQARSGGDGQNGNAINVYRAAEVTVRNNVIRGAAFSAIRGNAASHIRMIDNQCFALGEVAIYSEFEFEDAVIERNLIDVAAVGIAVTNMDKGGHGAVVRNNTIRNMVNKRPQGGPDSYGVGIGIEADTVVTGNIIENAPVMGIEVGSGKYLRNVTVSKNVLRQTGIGIGVTIVEGAGSAAITDNIISGAEHGAIVGMAWDKPATGDLSQGGAEKYPNVKLSGNQVS